MHYGGGKNCDRIVYCAHLCIYVSFCFVVAERGGVWNSGSARRLRNFSEILPDGRSVPVEVPGSSTVKDSHVVIVTKLPYTIQPDESLLGGAPASAYVFTKLKPEDASGIPRIETDCNNIYTGTLGEVVKGTEGQICAFAITSILPIPFALYMNELQGRRYHLFYNGICLISAISVVSWAVLDITGMQPYIDSLIPMSVAIVLMIAFVIFTMSYDLIKKRCDSYQSIAVGFIVFVLFGVAAKDRKSVV